MIGDRTEQINKQELQMLLNKMKKNADGVGSIDLLREKYPAGYTKLVNQIVEQQKKYLASAMANIQVSISPTEIQNTWGKRGEALKDAIMHYSSDKVQEVVSDFIVELMGTYQNKVLIGFEDNEKTA